VTFPFYLRGLQKIERRVTAMSAPRLFGFCFHLWGGRVVNPMSLSFCPHGGTLCAGKSRPKAYSTICRMASGFARVSRLFLTTSVGQSSGTVARQRTLFSRVVRPLCVQLFHDVGRNFTVGKKFSEPRCCLYIPPTTAKAAKNPPASYGSRMSRRLSFNPTPRPDWARARRSWLVRMAPRRMETSCRSIP
jgi:hypothetical protein